MMSFSIGGYKFWYLKKTELKFISGSIDIPFLLFATSLNYNIPLHILRLGDIGLVLCERVSDQMSDSI